MDTFQVAVQPRQSVLLYFYSLQLMRVLCQMGFAWQEEEEGISSGQTGQPLQRALALLKPASYQLLITLENNHTIIFANQLQQSTYDHRSVKTGHPVRSAIHKH